MGEITSYRGYKISKAAAEKLGRPRREEFRREEEVIEKVRETEPKGRTYELRKELREGMAQTETSQLRLRTQPSSDITMTRKETIPTFEEKTPTTAASKETPPSVRMTQGTSSYLRT